MKKLFVLFVLFMFSNLSAQALEPKLMFSNVCFGVLVGSSFNTIPTAGATMSIEVKSNVTSNINAKISLGYSTLYNDNSYEIRSYRFVSFDNYSKYHTRLFMVDRVKYTIIPVTLGAEYLITEAQLSPFTLLEVGYNFSSSIAEGITHDGIAGTFDTVNEIPAAYRKTAPGLEDGSSFSIGVGIGARYKLTDRMDMNIRYIYRYNDTIVNNNQILFGLTF